MKFIPILFSTPMVEAILDDRKTMTRRTKGLEKIFPLAEFVKPNKAWPKQGDWASGKNVEHNPPIVEILDVIKCPYGKPGDILWVREKFREYYHVDEAGYTQYDKKIIEFATDNPPMLPQMDADGFRMFNKNGSEKFIPWKSSLFMPKSACRLFLEITDVRVERLQEISWEDAEKEGCYGYRPTQDEPTHEFKRLWQSINGPESWEANPFVWVISFKQIEKPENFK